jgi:hypothetical protein
LVTTPAFFYQNISLPFLLSISANEESGVAVRKPCRSREECSVFDSSLAANAGPRPAVTSVRHSEFAIHSSSIMVVRLMKQLQRRSPLLMRR